MTTVTVFFAAAQTGEAICGTAEYWGPPAALTAIYGIRCAWRWATQPTHQRDLKRLYRWPEPDLNETDQAVKDLITCRRLYRTDPIDDQQRNTGTIQPRRKEQP